MCLGNIDGNLFLTQFGEADGFVGTGDLHAVAHEVAGQDGHGLRADIARADLTGPVEVHAGVDVHVVELRSVALAGTEEGQIGGIKDILDTADGGDIVIGGCDLVHLAIVAFCALEIVKKQLALELIGEIHITEVDATDTGNRGGSDCVNAGFHLIILSLEISVSLCPGVQIDIGAENLQIGVGCGGQNSIAGSGCTGDRIYSDRVVLYHGGWELLNCLSADGSFSLVGLGGDIGDDVVTYRDGNGDGLVQSLSLSGSGYRILTIGKGDGCAAEDHQKTQQKGHGSFHVFHYICPFLL